MPNKSARSTHQWAEALWYGNSRFAVVLSPLTSIFLFLSRIRKWKQSLSKSKFTVPVIVVGNITVGGTGKTPMVITLMNNLKQMGYAPGVASRGYGGSLTQITLINESHSASVAGDEPVMIFRNTQCPVVVSQNRPDAIKKLINVHHCNVVICDDGLQDYRFEHDVEIAMVDGERVFGNGRLLPAGPLRESISRLNNVDFIVTTSKSLPTVSQDCMHLQIDECRQLNNPQNKRRIEQFKGKLVHAVAGIGNPHRFFSHLTSLGLNVMEHPFRDHAQYSLEDFNFSEQYPILMTEKDAVKCMDMEIDNAWYLPVKAQLPENFMTRLKVLLRNVDG